MTHIKVTYGKREHRGGLQDSLDTAVEITKEEFENLLKDKSNNYTYYCFDERCNQVIFLGNYELKYMFLYIHLTTEDKDK